MPTLTCPRCGAERTLKRYRGTTMLCQRCSAAMLGLGQGAKNVGSWPWKCDPAHRARAGQRGALSNRARRIPITLPSLLRKDTP